MLLWNHRLVIAEDPPTAPPSVIGTLSEIRKAIRFHRRNDEMQDDLRRAKLAAFEADLPDSPEKIEAMDSAEIEVIVKKHFPDLPPFPEPADFDPTLSDQEFAAEIVDKLEPFFEGQSVVCLAFGRREGSKGQQWPDESETTVLVYRLPAQRPDHVSAGSRDKKSAEAIWHALLHTQNEPAPTPGTCCHERPIGTLQVQPQRDDHEPTS